MNPSEVRKALRAGDISVIVDVVNSVGVDALGYGDDGSSTLLHEAVVLGQTEFVSRLLGVDANARIADGNGEFAFHLAAMHNRVEIGRLLVKMRGLGLIDSRCANSSKQTALLHACSRGHVDFVRMLIEEQEATVTVLDDKGNNALILAILGNHATTVDYLAKWKRGALLQLSDPSGYSPLRLAIKLRHLNVLRALKKNGVDFDADDKLTRRNAFFEAVELNLPDVVAFLATELRCKVDAKNKDGLTPLHKAVTMNLITVIKTLISVGAKADAKDDKEANCPLHVAARLKNLEAIKVLCGQGKARTEVKNEAGRTVLGLVLTEHCDYETVKLLVQSFNADTTARGNLTDCRKATMFQLACMKGDLKLADLLYKTKEDLTRTNMDGDNALHLASSNGIDAAIVYLLDKGASIDLACSKGRTALHKAAMADHLSSLKILLRRGANLNAKSQCPEDENFTAKFLAAKHGALNVFRYLYDESGENKSFTTILHEMIKLAGNGDVASFLMSEAKPGNGGVGGGNLQALLDEGAFMGRTALHIACIYNRFDAAKSLIVNGGATINVRSNGDDFKRTPLHFAVLLERLDFIELFVKLEADCYAKDASKNPPLHLAALAGKLNVVRKLIELGLDVAKRGRRGATVLHSTCRWIGESSSDLPKAIRTKLSQLPFNSHFYPELCYDEIEPKKRPAGVFLKVFPEDFLKEEVVSHSTFSADAYLQKVAIAELLVQEMPALATVVDKHNEKPIFVAARCGHFDLVKFFVHWRRDLFLNTSSTGRHGLTLLQTAALAWQYTIVVFLLESGAKLDTLNCPEDAKETRCNVVELVAKEGAKTSGDCRIKALAILEVLIKHRAPLGSSLRYAVEAACERDSSWCDAIALLLNVDSCDTILEKASACHGDNVDVFNFLLRQNCKVNLIKDNVSLSPTYGHIVPVAYQVATQFGNKRIAQLLYVRFMTK